MEYFYFYPHIREGGLLIVDDVQIASIGHMANVIQEDAMWELVDVIRTTAVFRRTSAPLVNPHGDEWWNQGFNQRRAQPDLHFYLNDGGALPSFADRMRDHWRQVAAAKQAKNRKKTKKKSLLKRLFK